MPRADKDSHLNSNGHKSKSNKIWCEDCDREVSDSRHFQSGTHLRNQQNTQSTQQRCPSVTLFETK